MATKTYCDGCATEIPRMKKNAPYGQSGDGFKRVLQLSMSRGNNATSGYEAYVQTELCVGCWDRAFAVLSEALPAASADFKEWCETARVNASPPAAPATVDRPESPYAR